MTQLELDFGEEFAPQGKTPDLIMELARQAGFERLGHTDHDWVCYPEDIKRFADLVRADFMDKLVAHPSICRQIIDAGMLSSHPSGFKKRQPK